MSSLNLKGLWIPIEVLTDKNLSDKEKQYCFCTNKTISELLNISVTQVSKLVNSLKDKGYINIEMVYKENSKEVDMRRLIPIEEKFKDNKYNINKYKNTNNKRLCNFEQRDYEKEGFDCIAKLSPIIRAEKIG